jgi:CBS domain-containing protein
MRRLSEIISNQQLLAMSETASVKTACRRMRASHAGSVLIVDKSKCLVGIFTGRDAVCRVLAQGLGAAQTKLGDVMTPDPICLSPDRSAIEALRLMWDMGFRHVPVTTDGKPLGVVSRGDFEGIELDRHENEMHLWEHMR